MFNYCEVHELEVAGQTAWASRLFPVNLFHPSGHRDEERKFFAEETIQVAGKAMPLGRLATSEEIAHGCLFLVDPRSSYMTGTTLEMEGGLSLPWWSRRGTGDF